MSRLRWMLAIMLIMTAAAQHQPNVSVHTRDTANADSIDGSKNPDLIPDSTGSKMRSH